MKVSEVLEMTRGPGEKEAAGYVWFVPAGLVEVY